LELAKADLEYYDKIIDISRARFKRRPCQDRFGSIELQRVQYESESRPQSSICARRKFSSCCCSTIALPVDQFDVTGTFDLGPELQPLSDYHQIALDNRPGPPGSDPDHSAIAN